MDEHNLMPKIQQKELKKREQNFLKFIEDKNLERVAKLKQMQKNNKITGSILGAVALGIYAYTIVAIKQETFLDDFEPPVTIIETSK